MAKTITVVVPRKGISTGAAKVQTETNGFVGSTCVSADTFLHEAFGGNDTEEVLTDEYHNVEENQEHLTEGGGGGD